jgi:hypothetical protein
MPISYFPFPCFLPSRYLQRFVDAFKEMWFQNGDAISQAYAGTGAMKVYHIGPIGLFLALYLGRGRGRGRVTAVTTYCRLLYCCTCSHIANGAGWWTLVLANHITRNASPVDTGALQAMCVTLFFGPPAGGLYAGGQADAARDAGGRQEVSGAACEEQHERRQDAGGHRGDPLQREHARAAGREVDGQARGMLCSWGDKHHRRISDVGRVGGSTDPPHTHTLPLDQ